MQLTLYLHTHPGSGLKQSDVFSELIKFIPELFNSDLTPLQVADIDFLMALYADDIDFVYKRENTKMFLISKHTDIGKELTKPIHVTDNSDKMPQMANNSVNQTF
jgi:hypothetical protein